MVNYSHHPSTHTHLTVYPGLLIDGFSEKLALFAVLAKGSRSSCTVTDVGGFVVR